MTTVRLVLRRLERDGLLLESDQAFPNVVMLVAGEPVRGSWWAHPLANGIYDVTHRLAEDRDVIVCKLISGKNTFVHRRLWPASAVVGSANERWQSAQVSDRARQLLRAVRRAGELRTDHVPSSGRGKASVGEAARALERRLLVYSEEVHTESGRHAKQLETWEHWAGRTGLRTGSVSAAAGKRALESAVAALTETHRARGRLPWQR